MLCVAITGEFIQEHLCIVDIEATHHRGDGTALSRSFRREGHTNAPQAPFSASPGTGEGGGVWITFAGSCSDDSLMILFGGSWGDTVLSPRMSAVSRGSDGRVAPRCQSVGGVGYGGDKLTGEIRGTGSRHSRIALHRLEICARYAGSRALPALSKRVAPFAQKRSTFQR